MTSEYKYRGRDVKDVKERAEQQGGSFDSITNSSIPTLRVGKSHTLRIMPPPYDIDIDKWGKNWSIRIYIHYNVGPDKGTYLCLQKMGKGDCPICEARSEQDLQEGEQDNLKVSQRYLCYVVDRDNERDGPMLWNLPWTIERDIQLLSLDSKEGLLEIDHPEEGYDVSFTREGKGIQTKWSGLKIARKPSPISDSPKTMKAWLAYIEENPLPETLHYYSYEYIDKVFRAQTKAKDDDEREERRSNGRPQRRGREPDDDDRTTKARARNAEESDSRPARRSRPTEDEDEQQEETRAPRNNAAKRAAREEDEEEAEETPKTRTRSEDARERVNKLKSSAPAKRARVEEDDEEDNEEEEPPARKAQPATKRRARDEDEDEVPY